MKVDVYGLNEVGDDTHKGSIAWDGARWTLTPDSQLLRTILDEGCHAGPGRYYTKETPEEFLLNLHRQYRSAYLRVGQVQEDEPEAGAEGQPTGDTTDATEEGQGRP